MVCFIRTNARSAARSADANTGNDGEAKQERSTGLQLGIQISRSKKALVIPRGL
jgi:hypothetical protein